MAKTLAKTKAYFIEHGGVRMLKLSWQLLLKIGLMLLGIIAGTFLGVAILLVHAEVLVPPFLVFYFCVGIMLAQFSVLAVLTSVISKIFKLHIFSSPCLNFILGFLYPLLFVWLTEIVPVEAFGVSEDFFIFFISPLMLFPPLICFDFFILSKLKNYYPRCFTVLFIVFIFASILALCLSVAIVIM